MSEEPKPNKTAKRKIVELESTEIRGSIPKALYYKVLETSAAMGFTKSHALLTALSAFVSQNTELREEFIKSTAKELGITEKELRSEILNSYQQHGNIRRSKMGENKKST